MVIQSMKMEEEKNIVMNANSSKLCLLTQGCIISSVKIEITLINKR